MNAIIIGSGKVGSQLAETLVNDGHNVSVVDISAKALEDISEALDVMTLCGNGADVEILKEAGLESADIFISVTAEDEINLLTCLVADTIQPQIHTFARVRNPLYFRQTDFIREKLGIDRIINPEYQAAQEIYKLLQYPALNRIDAFENGKAFIYTVNIKQEYRLTGKSLQEIGSHSEKNILACVTERKGEIVIPSGDFVIQPGDDITFISTLDEMHQFFKEYGVSNKAASNCLIAGGGKLAYYLTERLLKKGKDVRIIEKDEKRCAYLSEEFPKAEIVYGDGTDRKILLKQGIQNTDAFVALTGIDEENLVISSYVEKHFNAKVVSKLNRTSMNEMVDDLKIDAVVFPKLICADIIAQHVRAIASGSSGNVESFYRYFSNRVEIIEFKVTDEMLTGIPLKELKIKKQLLIACIIQNGKFLIPNGNSMLMKEDHMIVVTTRKDISSVRDILD